MEIEVTTEQVTGGHEVAVHLRLSPRETSRLFLSGDTLIQLPTEGLVPEAESSPIPRTSIFISEIAGTKSGMHRVFSDASHADIFSVSVRTQLEKALEEL